jgi:23S rRNA (guanosine2251-2'-O)-methyltransferase
MDAFRRYESCNPLGFSERAGRVAGHGRSITISERGRSRDTGDVGRSEWCPCRQYQQYSDKYRGDVLIFCTSSIALANNAHLVQDVVMQREKVYIYGKHALGEALANTPHIIKKVFAAEHALDAEIVRVLKEKNIPLSPLKGEERQVSKDASHQGVIVTIDPTDLLQDLKTFLGSLDMAKNPALVLLDEVQDPHNVGAIIRSAAAFGIAGVLIPQNNQAQITGAVVKTSAGMAFRVPLVSIGNVNQTLTLLKERHFWAYGLAMEGSKELAQEKFDAPAVFVVGNEGEGVHKRTLELCDVSLSIPMHPRTESLNAAVSAAIVLYSWSLQHPDALNI